MNITISISATPHEMGRKASRLIAHYINAALAAKGHACRRPFRRILEYPADGERPFVFGHSGDVMCHPDITPL